MRLRVSLKLLLLIVAIAVALTTVSYWTSCDLERVTSGPHSRLERWRLLQSSNALPLSIGEANQSPFKRRTAGSNRKEPLSELADFDAADLGDQQQSNAVLLSAVETQAFKSQRKWGLPQAASRNSKKILNQDLSVGHVDCLINDDYSVPCLKESTEIYLPFYSFLKKYFEVYGKIAPYRGKERFEWQHSYSRVFRPQRKYDPRGSFLWFENYNVEVRERVKCISGINGVPVSTQWNPDGHIYPIQVAQFGLSHFSKNLTEQDPAKSTEVLGNDLLIQAQRNNSKVHILQRSDGTIHINAEADNEATISVVMEDPSNLGLTLSLDLMLLNHNSSVTAYLTEDTKPGQTYSLNYVPTDILISNDHGEVTYGIGSGSVDLWKRLTRDLRIDLLKGMSLMQTNKKKTAVPKLKSLHLHRLVFRGQCVVDNVTLSISAHMAHFYAASDWLVRNQDPKGGWPISVTRKLSNGMLELSPGWYSAMAQGQAMSLLTRAFRTSGNMIYLRAAIAATKLFFVRSENGGVMTTFLGKYVWYEEYPTVPSSFVLNGFIYSLIGLYDLRSTCTHVSCREATQLFEEGMVSLKKMLTLFDTGSGTVYDLRHFTLGVAPNLARWDYHTTHINQLLLLSTIDSDPIIKITAERWIGYMKGKRAPHN